MPIFRGYVKFPGRNCGLSKAKLRKAKPARKELKITNSLENWMVSIKISLWHRLVVEQLNTFLQGQPRVFPESKENSGSSNRSQGRIQGHQKSGVLQFQIRYIYTTIIHTSTFKGGAKWFLKGVNSPRVSIATHPLARCWSVCLTSYMKVYKYCPVH